MDEHKGFVTGTVSETEQGVIIKYEKRRDALIAQFAGCSDIMKGCAYIDKQLWFNFEGTGEPQCPEVKK